jgi:hypothetical protein
MATLLPIFQVNVPTKLAQVALTASVVTVYTTQSTNRVYVQDITVVNTNATSATFNIFLVPATATASTANAIFYNCTLSGGQTVQWTGSQILFPGDTIQVQASTTGLTASISGQQAS